MKKTIISAAMLLMAAAANAQLANNINLGWQFALNNDTANVPTSWRPSRRSARHCGLQLYDFQA